MASTQQLLLGEGAGGGEKNYIEDVFSTYVYAGSGAAKTITNNIDLSTKGGMVWIKCRNEIYNNIVSDTTNGATKFLRTNTTDAQITNATSLTAFNTTGYSIGAYATINSGAYNFASWTFRKQPKFFDIVQYTGTGAGLTVSHNLGSTPGCMIIKATDDTDNWYVWHRGMSSATQSYMYLNLVDAAATSSTFWNNTAPTSTQFSVGNAGALSKSGVHYTAYLFAHDAGGFGLTGTDNVISCGSMVAPSTGSTVNLGWEPQWLLYKTATGTGDWKIIDNMRGFPAQKSGGGTYDQYLKANSTTVETQDDTAYATSTGFLWNAGTSNTIIYIAIRRGPMKVPTDATKVFAPVAQNASAFSVVTTNFPTDLSISSSARVGSKDGNTSTFAVDRLRGNTNYVATNTGDVEGSFSYGMTFNTGTANVSYTDGWWNYQSGATSQIAYWNFRRAPGFFDQVCYTGSGTTTTVPHNLGVAPELMLIKIRGSGLSRDWRVYAAPLGNTKTLILNAVNGELSGTTLWNSTSPTASSFTVMNSSYVNGSGYTYVAYLFASCPGVSKVGSYTGTGATQTINCGFTGGARFVWTKRTDTDSDWYIWDTARGMVSGTDPKIPTNTGTAASNADWVYTATTGFQIVTSNAAVNASGGSYIFLAIA